MAIRNDISIEWELSPRLAEINSASGEITVQDSHDTLADIEDTAEAHQFPFLVSTAGKENLGGGTEVGLTTTLQNLQYAPQRTAPRSTSTDTITTGSSSAVICSGADFVSDGVSRGDYVVNWTDQSVTEVLSVTSGTELQVRTPTGLAASSDDFAVNDVITVWETSEFGLAGGNFVAIDNVDADINPMFPVFGRFISKASASSATTQSQAVLEHAVFAEKVTLDQSNSTGLAATGEDYPAGTTLQPCLTLADAKTIAAREGFSRLEFIGDFNFAGGDNIDGFTCTGEGPSLSELDLGATTSTIRTQFINCELTGDVNGAISVEGCHIDTITGVGSTLYETTFRNSLLEPGTVITLDTTSGLQNVHIVDCDSGSPGDTPVIIDHNGSDAQMTIRKYAGGMKLNNITDATVEISFDGDGHLTLDSTCTNGDIAVRGDVKITDNSVTMTVTDQTSPTLVWLHSSALTLQKWLGLR